MLFVALFDDDPARSSVRTEQMKAHLAYLDRKKDRIVVGGSLREEPDRSARGGLRIIEATSKEAALRLCRTDPFRVHGLRRSVEVLHWSKAFPERTAVV